MWYGVLAALLTRLIPSAQAQAPYFNNRYPGPPQHVGYLSTTVATDSGFTVSGQVFDQQAARMGLQLRWLAPNGQTQRVRYYQHPTRDWYAANRKGLFKLASGYVLAGTVLSVGLSAPMLWRFDALGDTLWTKTYVDSVPAIAYGACRTRDGGYMLVGVVTVQRRTRGLSCLWRLDSAGNLVWRKYYGSRAENVTRYVTPTPDGGFVASGLARTPVGGLSSSSYVYKVDSAGTLLWQRFYGTAGVSNGAGALVVTRDGNYILPAALGRPPINGEFRGQHVIYKISPTGQLLWQRVVGRERGIPNPHQTLELADGSLIVAGDQTDGDTATVETPVTAFIYKLCADGDTVWLRAYRKLTGLSSDNYQMGLIATPDGGFLGTGYLFPSRPDTGSYDGWAFRIDSLGYLQAGGAPPARVCPRPTGTAAPGPVGPPLVGVRPNPAPHGRFTLSGAGGAAATVHDALGRPVWRGRLPAEAETALDLSTAPPGLYLLRLAWPDGRATTFKLVIQ